MKKTKESETLSIEAEKPSDEIQDLFLTLPKVKYLNGADLYQYEGFWFPSYFLHGIISSQKHFQAQDTDIILTTYPKSGTTWLKALTYSIVNRSRYALEDSPLLTSAIHELVLSLEFDLYNMKNQAPTPEDLPNPRIFSTHTPYPLLPPSILNSNCRVVYLCRNPLDQFISFWYFLLGNRDQAQTSEQISVDEAFEMTCNGVQSFGPFCEHVLGFWKQSLEKPQKILFLKYEDLQENINFYVKKLADFLECPFSEDEESQGVIEKISDLCSFDKMKEMKGNKNGQLKRGTKNSSYFRKGVVGDWTNFLTPSMSDRMQKLVEEKLSGSGLTFQKQ